MLTLFGHEDVNDKVDVVHQHPLALATAFDGVGIGAELLFQAVLNLVGDGDVLPLVGAAADEKVIGQCTLAGVEREDAYVFCLLAVAGVYGDTQELVRFK